MTRRRWWIAALALVAVGAGFALWSRQGGAERPTPAVATAPAEPPGVGALGRIEPASRTRKLTQPGGFAISRLERLHVAEGDRVVAGQLLAEFGDAPQRDAAVRQQQAAVAEARAQLAKIRAAGRPSEIEAQRARIAALTAQEGIARRDADRATQLVPTGAGAAALADRGRAAAARAAADLAEAVAQLETLSRPRPEDVALAEAQLAAAEATLQARAAEAALTRVTAPIAGTVLKIYARPGEQVGSDGLLDLADLEQLDVVADVYETDLPRLRAGASAEVLVPGDARRYPATVREIGWQVRRTVQANTDPVAAIDARTVEVRLTLSEEGRAVLLRRTNMQVQVAIRP